jgi:hypothetical protein
MMAVGALDLDDDNGDVEDCMKMMVHDGDVDTVNDD